MEIATEAYRLINNFPKEERFGLSGQITRAAVSIPSNIAEGSSRSSEKEACRFMEIALGSCFELETQLLIAQSLNFGDAALRDGLIKKLIEEYIMLQSFISVLKTS